MANKLLFSLVRRKRAGGHWGQTEPRLATQAGPAFRRCARTDISTVGFVRIKDFARSCGQHHVRDAPESGRLHVRLPCLFEAELEQAAGAAPVSCFNPRRRGSCADLPPEAAFDERHRLAPIRRVPERIGGTAVTPIRSSACPYRSGRPGMVNALPRASVEERRWRREQSERC